jgi:hypothetical protein
MVLEAFNLPPDKAKQQVEEALKLDPDCISAYEVLAVLQGSVESTASAVRSRNSVASEIRLLIHAANVAFSVSPVKMAAITPT